MKVVWQMGTPVTPRQPHELETRWHLSIIPLYMAIGSPGLLATLVALSLGANVAEIGAMTAAGAVATFIFSIVWGKLSDFSGIRKRYLLFFTIALGPIFITLSMANSVQQVIIIYTIASAITAGVAPIAVMYTVECCKLEDWQNGVARFTSITSIGNILGLLIYTVTAPFIETRWLFYISAVTCFSSALFLWILGQEPEMTLERHSFPVKSLRDAEKFLSPKPFLHYLDLRRIKLPKNLRQMSPLQLLFLAAFIHWTGISLFGLGQTPLMKALGLTDSLILAINVVTGVTAAIAFAWIAPRIESGYKRSLNLIVIARCGLILCWAALPFFLIHPIPLIFMLPLVISIAFNVLYSLIWLPITTFAISQAPADLKGSVQGELLSATALAGAVGSAIGGLVINAYGYTAGFVLASFIALLVIPILSRFDMTKPTNV
jgi:MFS family permease